MRTRRRKLRGSFYRYDSKHSSRLQALKRASVLRGWGYRASVKRQNERTWVVWKAIRK